MVPLIVLPKSGKVAMKENRVRRLYMEIYKNFNNTRLFVMKLEKRGKEVKLFEVNVFITFTMFFYIKSVLVIKYYDRQP